MTSGMRLSIRFKTLALLLLVALSPIIFLGSTLLPRYGRAVRSAEERTQLAVIAKLADSIDQHLLSSIADAHRLASAVHRASLFTGPDEALAIPFLVESISSSQTIAVARLEIPDARPPVNTLLRKQGVSSTDAPASTAELREEALLRGAAFELLTASTGRLVVPVPLSGSANGSGPQGFITVPVHLSQFRYQFEQIIAELQQAEGNGSVAVITREGTLVVGHEAGVEPGELADLPVFLALAPMDVAGGSVGGAVQFEGPNGAMLGTTRSIEGLGWTVGFWRPLDQALEEYVEVKRTALTSAIGMAVVVLLVALFAARALTFPLLRLGATMRTIGARQWDAIGEPSTRKDEIGDLARAVHTMAHDLRSGEQEIARSTKLRADLSRFMSREVVERIVSGEHSLELGGRRSNVTVLFADMVAFTSASEVRPPEQVVKMLNELFTVLTEVVFRHGGVVDKFIGDCLMAVWGAPLAEENHAAKAVAAAEDMMRFLEIGAEGWRQRYGLEVRVAIGINSGAAVVGNIGSDKRMDYTVVGDVVNVAARLESIAAPNQVLVAEETQRSANGFRFRLLGARNLTGRARSVNVYELCLDYD